MKDADIEWTRPTKGNIEYNVLMARVPFVNLIAEVYVELGGQDVKLSEYLRMTQFNFSTFFDGHAELSFNILDSRIIHRDSRSLGLMVYEIIDMKHMWVFFKDEDRFVNIHFWCLKPLFDETEEEFWSIADSYEYVQ